MSKINDPSHLPGNVVNDKTAPALKDSISRRAALGAFAAPAILQAETARSAPLAAPNLIYPSIAEGEPPTPVGQIFLVAAGGVLSGHRRVDHGSVELFSYATALTLASSAGAGVTGYSYNAPYLSGTVGNKLASSITLRELGVLGDGTNEAVALQGAIDAVAGDAYFDGRHITLLGDAHAAYNFTRDINITRPHFTLDLMGATVITNWRFMFRGNPDGEDGAMENDDLLLDDVHFRNAQFGNPADLTLPTRGPMFQWVRNSSMKNVVRLSRGGTPFNFHFAKNCLLKNIAAKDARTVGEGGAIGILLLHTHGCTVQDFEVTGPGEWVYGVQQKGGFANRWINGRIHDIEYANPKGQLFRDRGDSPYDGQSRTGGPYPYRTKGWREADVRRACNDTQWINLLAQNTPDTMPAFATGEAKGSRVSGLTVIHGRGISMSRRPTAPAGYDDHHQIDGFRGIEVVLPLVVDATGASPMENLRISDFRVTSMRATALATQRGISLTNVAHPILKDIDINAPGDVAESALRHVRCSGISYENLNIAGVFRGAVITEDAATNGTRFNGGSIDRARGAVPNRINGGNAQVFSKLVASAFTTTNALTNNFTRTGPATNATQYLTVTAIARAPAIDESMRIRVGRFFKNAAGVVTALGAAPTVVEESRVGAAAWTVTMEVAANRVRINCQGVAATHIDWEVSYEWS